MKKVRIFTVALLGIIVAAGLVFAGCKDTIGSNGGGCKGDGACYYIRANNDYKWCGDESCAVWKTTDTGQASISCNCK